MALLSSDGDYTIYIIQVKLAGCWHQLNDDRFPAFRKHITASLPCWQQTGIMGTFDYERAERCLEEIRATPDSRRGAWNPRLSPKPRPMPKSHFRIRKIVISQMSMAPEQDAEFFDAHYVDGYVYCDVHGEVHEETGDPYFEGGEPGVSPECNEEAWHSLYISESGKDYHGEVEVECR